MTKIIPFKAIRPTRDKAHLVATMPYYTYKKNVLDAKLEQNPYTFLHVINPEFHADDKTEPNSVERFLKTRAKFDDFVREGIFIQDNNPCLYIYRQTKDGHEYLGIIGGASVEQYNSGHIKKHEATLTSREEVFSNYLATVNFNAEPVLLFHQFHHGLYIKLNELIKERPEYEFTSTEKIKHEIWLVDKFEDITQIQKYFAEIPNLYIADGHHRCASSARFTNSLGNNKSQTQDHFLAYFISQERMFILEYNRVVKDLNNLSEDVFLTKVSGNFFIEKAKNFSSRNLTLHQMGMYLNGTWYLIKPKNDLFDANSAVDILDTAILTNLLLDPVLNIKDLKTDDRIDFVGGNKGIEHLEYLVDSNKFKIAFALAPVTVEQLIRVSDENKIMPPKSTWIEPKLRSGLTIYPLD